MTAFAGFDFSIRLETPFTIITKASLRRSKLGSRMGYRKVVLAAVAAALLLCTLTSECERALALQRRAWC